MTDPQRFLAALGPTDDDGRADAFGGWPGAARRSTYNHEDPILGQWLDDRSIEAYLTGLQGCSSTRGSATPGRPREPVTFSDLGDDWRAERYPLMLCEFLAYKSGLAYRSPQIIRRNLLGLDALGRRYSDGIDQFAFFDSSARYGDTQAFAFVHQRTGYIVFRGTSSVADVLTDFYDRSTTETYAGLPTLPQTLVGAPRPARHTGFAVAWGAVAPDISAWIEDQHDLGLVDDIVLTGHSLGGALAILAAHQLARQNMCTIKAVITFGAPMVGGEEFKRDYESPRLGLKDRTLRVESAEDVVASITKRATEYCHVGMVWRFKKRPLRPNWQMVLFSPLIDVEQAAKQKTDRLRRKMDAQPADRSGHTTSVGSNMAIPVRTWHQFVRQLAMRLLWQVLRAALLAMAAHSAEHRYALYLSTLSYRRIRAYRLDQARILFMRKRGQETERILVEKAFRDARRDLSGHLAVVRGREPRTVRQLMKRPVRIDTPAQLASLEKRFVNYLG